jgi:hypothetical protein
MLLVTPAVAGLKFSHLETSKVLEQRLTDQRRTVHPHALSGSIGGTE